MTNDTPICIASITKLYTASAIMHLYEKGLLSLDDTMSKYLPDELIKGIHVFKGKDYSYEITIKQLLSHTSGIADYYLEKPKGGKNCFELFLEYPEKSWSVNDTIKIARQDLKPNFIPGTKVSYSDTNFQLLGKIIESITDKPLHVIFDEFFFKPLELDHTWLINYSRPYIEISINPADIFYKNKIITNIRHNKAYWADGGIVSTAKECIIFLKALNDGKLISKKSLKMMHNWHKLEFPLKYGYGTMYFKLPDFMTSGENMPGLWGHSGSTGSFLYYSEDFDVYLSGTINLVGSNSKPFKLMYKVMNAVHSKD
jgi:CubicO group peptidase (beta-lactamase class C family)